MGRLNVKRNIHNYIVHYGLTSCIIEPLKGHTRLPIKEPILADYDNLPRLPQYLEFEIKRQRRYLRILYVIHFEYPYKHARHYLGSTYNLDARVARHEAGNGARLMQVVKENNIPYRVHVIGVGDKYEEHRLKSHSSSRYCPECEGRSINGYVCR